MNGCIRMEERYSKLELLCNDNCQEALSIIEELLAKYKLTPELFIEDGVIEVEFHDDYDKRAGPFYEELAQKLGISLSCI